ncbi:MAG: polysaccharide deacetylase family protein, partial [Elusimicrobia bacterium]|nr:polysaccharide deacetylase family protein [Elusimicrobiota bacterium]
HLFAFYRAKATFFMLGDSLQVFPDLAREVSAEGHQLANHTWTHTNFYNVYDPDKLTAEILKTYAQIDLLTGKKTHFVRIPYGVSKQWAKECAAKAEHLLVNWTYGVDTRLEKTQEEMLAGYSAHLRPGAIFLFHDGGNQKPKTVWVVERLLEECRRRGLKPVTLDTMFGVDHSRFPRPAVVAPLPDKGASPRRSM